MINHGKRPTLRDIADELGVTTMTVSKSLRGIGRISDETRRLVRSKAEELGYLSSTERLFPPFVKAPGGSDHRMNLLCPTIGPLDRGATMLYRNDMVDGLNRKLSAMNGTMAAESFSSLDDLLELLSRNRYHGIVLSEPYPTRWIRAIGKLCPVIYTIGHDFQAGVDSVYFNEARAAALAADRLRKAGHRQIGWLGIRDWNAPFLLPDDEFSGDDAADWLSHSAHGTRYASWLYLASQHSCATPWPVCLVDRDWKTCSLGEAVKRGCRKLLAGSDRPTAIVCVASAIGRELITQLEIAGLRVPRDVSVVAYGVEEGGTTPDGHQLSGLVMPMEKVGGLVPEVVQRRLAYPEGLSISIQLDAEWAPGETVRRKAR